MTIKQQIKHGLSWGLALNPTLTSVLDDVLYVVGWSRYALEILRAVKR